MKEIRISVPEGVSEFSVQVNKDGIATVLYDVPIEDKQEAGNTRWRAPIGEKYFCIMGNLSILAHTEEYDRDDYALNQIGNYFKTWEAAVKAAEQIREIFKNSEAE